MSKIDFNYGVGFEVEAYGFNLKVMKNYLCNVLKVKCNTSTKSCNHDLDYSVFNLSNEGSVSKEFLDTYLGGEVISPVIYNSKDLDRAFDITLRGIYKSYGYDLDKKLSNAGYHIHFSKDFLDNDPIKYMNLIKLVTVYANEIMHLSKEDEEELRNSYSLSARTFKYKYLNNIFTLQEVSRMKYNGDDCSSLFHSKSNNISFLDKTFEFRMFNSPLISKENNLFDIEKSKKRMWDNFNLARSLVSYSSSNDFDIDLMDYYIKDYLNMPTDFNNVDENKLNELKKMLKY